MGGVSLPKLHCPWRLGSANEGFCFVKGSRFCHAQQAGEKHSILSPYPGIASCRFEDLELPARMHAIGQIMQTHLPDIICLQVGLSYRCSGPGCLQHQSVLRGLFWLLGPPESAPKMALLW